LDGVLATIIVTLIPVGLIMLQPDLDSALLFGPALLVMLLVMLLTFTLCYNDNNNQL
jgi:cell division protein FtsW (lipid II flippase)